MSESEHLWRAIDIQRRAAPEQWRAEIERLPAEAQEECRRYLRGVYHRLQVVAAVKAGRPPPAPPDGI